MAHGGSIHTLNTFAKLQQTMFSLLPLSVILFDIINCAKRLITKAEEPMSKFFTSALLNFISALLRKYENSVSSVPVGIDHGAMSSDGATGSPPSPVAPPTHEGNHDMTDETAVAGALTDAITRAFQTPAPQTKTIDIAFTLPAPVIPQVVIDAAKTAARKWSGSIAGTPICEIWPSVCIAQWALESDYGNHMPHGSNNPFGIKAKGSEPFVEVWTHEFMSGRYVKVLAKFAKFDSLNEAFDLHAKLLAKSGYYWKARHAGNPNSFANDLTGVYATDPHYGAKLIQIMKDHNLYQYDAI